MSSGLGGVGERVPNTPEGNDCGTVLVLRIIHTVIRKLGIEPGLTMKRRGWQLRAGILWLVVVYAISAGVSWGEEPLVLTQKDSGKTVTVTVGQRLRVDLNLGPGHHVVAPEFDPSILALVGQSMQSTSGPKVASSRVVYEFLVRQGGQTDLVIAAKGDGNQEGKSEPLLKVKIVASGGGQTI